MVTSTTELEDETRVVVVAKMRLHRECLTDTLRRRFRLLRSAASPTAASVVILEDRSHVAVVDLSGFTDDHASIECVAQLNDAFPDTAIVGICAALSAEVALSAAEAGVLSLLGPDTGSDQLVAAVTTAARGEATWSPHTVAVLQQRLAQLARTDRARGPIPLTAREMTIMRLLCEGLSNGEIATRLTVAVSTVKNHIHNIYRKLGVHHRTQAIARWRHPDGYLQAGGQLPEGW